MVKICVIDVETTGVDATVDKVCEIGVVEMEEFLNAHGPQSMSAWSSYVDPVRSIPPTASAIHHIIDEDVDGAPEIEFVLSRLPDDMDYAVAHNAKFEAQFLPEISAPWICTYKCSYELYADAPAHNLQTLRYWRGHDEVDGVTRQHGAHRALPDARVCAVIFLELAQQLTLSEMAAISSRPVFMRAFPFGKHANESVEDIPSGYLKWMCGDRGYDEDITYTANEELDRRTNGGKSRFI